MSALEKYCIHCMRELAEDGSCSFCSENRTVRGKHQLKPGTKLEQGNYVIGDVLGEGGFGITYIGRDRNLLNLVAIKEYYPVDLVERNNQEGRSVHTKEGVADAKERFRSGMNDFLDEARMLSRFRQIEGIVKVHRFFRENDTAYFVMDYVDGVSVKEYITQNGKLKPETVLEMVKKPILALQKVHESGLVHRDISADNLMISVDGALTLIDFGASRLANTVKDRTRTAFYKPSFSALEQYSQRSLQGAWTDVYGLCATIYYMISGELPASATDRVLEECLKPLKEIPGIEISDELSETIQKGMAIDREKRIQNMGQLYEALYREKLKADDSEKSILDGMERGKQSRSDEKSGFTARLLSLTHMNRELNEIAGKRRQKKRRKLAKAVAVAVMCVCLAAGSVWGYVANKSTPNAVRTKNGTQKMQSTGTGEKIKTGSGQNNATKKLSDEVDTADQASDLKRVEKPTASAVPKESSKPKASSVPKASQNPKTSSNQKASQKSQTASDRKTSRQSKNNSSNTKTVQSSKTSSSAKRSQSSKKASVKNTSKTKTTSKKNTTNQSTSKKSTSSSKADQKIMKLPEGNDGLDGDLDSMNQ